MDKIQFQPIAHFRCSQQNRYDSPRQAPLSSNEGNIELVRNQGYEQSLVGLQAGDWIWILFVFHKNAHWKPMVRPPRGTDGKIGVFATRAPYRPNPIGMSVVQVVSIDGLKVVVSKHDLLDGTPILDIKPYLDLADSLPGVGPSWLDQEELHKVNWSEKAHAKSLYLESLDVSLKAFVDYQLQFNPLDSKRKRVRKITERSYELAYRTWRVKFLIVRSGEILVQDIVTGYDMRELDSADDPWRDKSVHRKFLKLSDHHVD